MTKKVVVLGGSGAIGNAFARDALARFPSCELHMASRRECAVPLSSSNQRVVGHSGFDLGDEASLAAVIETIFADGQPDLVLIATGILHGEDFGPERRLQDLNQANMEKLFAVNVIGPSLIIKHLLPALDRSGTVRIGAISARVGSISDNHLGGWYSYRASKAALNMMIKSAAVELSRRNKEAVLVGLHPGTVDSALSRPFQSSVPKGKLFTPEHSAACLMDVLMSRLPEHSGRCYDWAGKEIEP